MKKILAIKMIVVMMLITSISGLILSGIWAISKDKIAQNEKATIQDALYDINPDVKNFKIEKIAGEEVYKCYNSAGSLISYFFLATGNGFQAPIKIAISVTPGFKRIIGVRILEQTETPGLGAKIVEPDFLKKFEKLILFENKPVVCRKEDADKEKSEIRAITGATISSKACVSIINDKISVLKYLVGER